jgi:hypothetical protein
VTRLGEAEIITRQVAELPPEAIGWRVVRSLAEGDTKLVPDAPFAERSLGFVIPDAGVVVVFDQATGGQAVAGPDWAVPVGQGDVQQRTSPTGEPAAYYAIELVAEVDLENPATIGGADLLYVGPSFPSPGGLRFLSISGAELTAGERAVVGTEVAPVLVLVTEGEVRVDGGSTLAAGESGVYSGEIEVSSGDAGGRFVVAAIGEPASGPGGIFAVETFACPTGMTLQTFEAEACSRSDTPLVEWTLSSDDWNVALSVEDATVVDGTVLWQELPEGTYYVELTETGFASGYADYWIPSSDQVTRQGERTTRFYYPSAFIGGAVNAYVFQS